MKRYILIITAVSLFTFSAALMAQEKPMDSAKHKQMMEMMQDSTMMSIMMEHITKDDHMRNMMMQKMMQSAKGNESRMMEMCKKMMADKEMHSMMMKMMHSDMDMAMKSESMQQPEKMHMHDEHHKGEPGHTQTSDSANREVLIKFKPDARKQQITSMATEIGMQEVKEIKELNLRVFKITSNKSVDEVIKHCEDEPFVEYVEANKTYKTQK